MYTCITESLSCIAKINTHCKSVRVCAQLLRSVRLFATLWTVARQAPLFMGFSRQEYWSGLPFPPPGDFLNPEVEPASPTFPALAGGFLTTEPKSGSPLGSPNQVYVNKNIDKVNVCVCVYIYTHTYIYKTHQWIRTKNIGR